jgi:4-amino-4-deoxy-L-arabinose transferase-like glycosyltransferase
MAAHPEESLWSDRVFLAIAVASLIVKLTLAILAAGIEPVKDEPDYIHGAYLIANGQEWTNHFRPPLYVWFFASVVASGGNPDTVRIVQALLATLCLLPVYSMGRMIGGSAGGL